MTEYSRCTTYTSDSLYNKGLIRILSDMFHEVVSSRELIYRLFLRNFVSRYKQSLLSWGWIFFMPLVTISTFIALNISGVLSIGDLHVPYPIFGLLGISLWNIFSNGLPNATTSLTMMNDLIGKINFAKSSVIFSSIGQVLIDFSVRTGLLLFIFAIYLRLPSWHIILLPLLILPLVFFTVGISFITSIMQVVFKDTINFVNLTLSLFLFLLPIMYEFPKKGFLYNVNRYNPIYYLLTVPRDLILFGETNDLAGFFISSMIAFVVFIAGWFIFYLSENKLAERI